jgi:hypothetical protein
MIAQFPSPQGLTPGPPSFVTGGYPHGPNPIPHKAQFCPTPLLQPPGYQAHYPVLNPPVPGFSGNTPPARGFTPQASTNSGGILLHCVRSTITALLTTIKPPPKPSAREADMMDYVHQQEPSTQFQISQDEAPPEFAVVSSSNNHCQLATKSETT